MDRRIERQREDWRQFDDKNHFKTSSAFLRLDFTLFYFILLYFTLKSKLAATKIASLKRIMKGYKKAGQERLK